MIKSIIERIVNAYTPDEEEENWDFEGLSTILHANLLRKRRNFNTMI